MKKDKTTSNSDDSDPTLDKTEVADAYETEGEAENKQRKDAPERTDEDITTLDPPD